MATSTHAPAGRLANKVAIVTGASAGLGRAIARAYIREGTKVGCADLKLKARPQIEAEAVATTLELLQKEGGKDRAIFCKTDVSEGEDVRADVRPIRYVLQRNTPTKSQKPLIMNT